MEKLVRRAAGSRGVHALMSAVLEKHTVSAAAIWQLLLVAQETKPCPLSLLMEEIRREPGANAFFRAGRVPGTLCSLCPSRGYCQSCQKIELSFSLPHPNP